MEKAIYSLFKQLWVLENRPTLKYLSSLLPRFIIILSLETSLPSHLFNTLLTLFLCSSMSSPWFSVLLKIFICSSMGLSEITMWRSAPLWCTSSSSCFCTEPGVVYTLFYSFCFLFFSPCNAADYYFSETISPRENTCSLSS